MKTTIAEGFTIDCPTESVVLVAATPDRDYPLRILRAYLSDCHVECTVQALADTLNEATKSRNEWLNKAITILERHL